MKKAAVLAFALLFAVGLFHFYYAEDHCPVHCPSRGVRFGHVHPHQAGATTCLCFLTALAGPESAELPAAAFAFSFLARPSPGRILGMTAMDVTPPPRSSRLV